MSKMSDLHAEIAEITQDDVQTVRCFHDGQAAHRWGMLTAARVLLATAQDMRGDQLETMLWAHEAIMEAVKMARPES